MHRHHFLPTHIESQSGLLTVDLSIGNILTYYSIYSIKLSYTWPTRLIIFCRRKHNNKKVMALYYPSNQTWLSAALPFCLLLLFVLRDYNASAWVLPPIVSTRQQHQQQHQRSLHNKLSRTYYQQSPDNSLKVGGGTLEVVNNKHHDLFGQQPDSDGIYLLENEEEHKAFLETHKDKLVIMKVYAPWCRACKGLEPKFIQVAQDKQYADLPMVFCQLSIQHNKGFVKELGVLALPTVQFYVGGTLADNFPCGPSKFPLLKRKLATLVNDHVDVETNAIKVSSMRNATEGGGGSSNVMEDEIGARKSVWNFADKDTSKQTLASNGEEETVTMSEEAKRKMTSTIPYFSDLSLADLDVVFSKAKQVQYEAGTVLFRQGGRGRTFYVLVSGEVEVMIQQDAGMDPLVAPNPLYMGAVINRLGPGDYFGERALITGEPRAASIRATEEVTAWAFDKDDFPPSSVLSGRTLFTTELDIINDKYGVSLNDMYTTEVDRQVTESSLASMKRGSVNSPNAIRGVDTDDDVSSDAAIEDSIGSFDSIDGGVGLSTTNAQTDAILSLLTRFQMIRHVSQCYDYIINMRAGWGDEGVRTRRSMLVKRLSPAKKTEFMDTFKLIDRNGDGTITLLELKQVMESIGESKSDFELREMIGRAGANAMVNGASVMTQSDFMGIMAEADFYSLFKEIFSTLDKQDSGFVKASELDRVLCGVRDLISDDRKSIIDVEDQDMLIDYEQFSRMLLGSALL